MSWLLTATFAIKNSKRFVTSRKTNLVLISLVVLVLQAGLAHADLVLQILQQRQEILGRERVRLEQFRIFGAQLGIDFFDLLLLRDRVAVAGFYPCVRNSDLAR